MDGLDILDELYERERCSPSKLIRKSCERAGISIKAIYIHT